MIAPVAQQDIMNGLRALGFDASSAVIVHASLRSFGYVDGGALAVCRALAAACGTLVLPASSWHLTGVPAPPGLRRPDNAVSMAATWQEFDAAVARAVPYSADLPIDRALGPIPETARRALPHRRSPHPLLSFLAIGQHADHVLAAQRLDWPLGPLEALADLGGDVLLLGVTHASNTAIHLAEQRLGRSCFWRYAKAHDRVWMELPNIPGESGGFDDIEPGLLPATQEIQIGACHARRVAIADVLTVATRMILDNPAALLRESSDPDSRYTAALRQRLARLSVQE
jgi:aminoglycoside 3-N-acetyltransferase